MNIVIDMNLTPDWCEALARGGHAALHWSDVGDPRAKDWEIMRWAADNRHVVLTHDLDFGAILAATQAVAPSVVQIRAEDTMPNHLGRVVLNVLDEHQQSLEAGAIVVIDDWRSRVRVLPIGRK
jgi:predicted nuclease of predicted toxin-antitoxin system